MSRPPLIGLVGRRKRGSDVAGFPETMRDADLDVYLTDYARGVLEAGGLPVHLPLEADPALLAGRLDGIVLTGGADVGPENYGASPETDLFPPEAVRDRFELALLDVAVAGALPVLGICRGLQIVNVHAGGTLHQDIPPHARFDLDPATEVHEVRFTPSSVLHGLYGDHATVNSLHHQTVDRVGDGYVVTARSDDGTVEGLEHRRLPIVTVQWHPEMMSGRSSDPAFAWLVDAATHSRPD